MLLSKMREIFDSGRAVHRLRGTEAYIHQEEDGGWSISVTDENEEIESLPVRLGSPEIQLHLVPLLLANTQLELEFEEVTPHD